MRQIMHGDADHVKERTIDHMTKEQWLVRQDVGMTSHHPHERAAAALRTDITAGTYAAGAELPGQRELAEKYGVAQNTMGQALRLLEAEGLVEMAPRRRTRVLQSIPHLEVQISGAGHLQPADTENLGHIDLRAGTRVANQQAAEALLLPPSARLFENQAVLLHAGTPWATQTLLTAAEPDTGDGTHAATVAPFAAGAARQESGHRSRWSARPATAEENRQLRGHGLTVLEIHRVGYINNRPHSYLLTVVRADRVTILTESSI
ncbi:GntR family transcriptional regulator [Streptomyces clavuligerus]|uniref:GntR family transcriptional regulator n=1 Tax=Streptomyces clavuligerus TaxID=1901 RepID=UPI00020D9547|nr:GntR family transcriptional regulator [Streptomyces clavuligerus]WDN56229.1 GntR family transcriptional regulator [Streptomyces clavuligerus]